MAVITEEKAIQLFPFLSGKGSHLKYKIALKATGIDFVNRIHQNLEDQGVPPGPDFAKGLILDQIGVDMLIGNPENLDLFPQGAFITISNHFYGHLDGIALVDVVGHLRPKVKVMVNELLMNISGLAPNFISVNPTTTKRETTATNINGVKNALLQLKSGEPLCLFPSGAVADLKPRQGWSLSEREWQDAAVRLIRKARVPVVPIRFFDRNSWFYYALGLIDYRIRFMRLFSELKSMRGTRHRMGIGRVISVQEQAAVPDSEFKDFLRRSVYDMPLPEHFVKRSELWK